MHLHCFSYVRKLLPVTLRARHQTPGERSETAVKSVNGSYGIAFIKMYIRQFWDHFSIVAVEDAVRTMLEWRTRNNLFTKLP